MAGADGHLAATSGREVSRGVKMAMRTTWHTQYSAHRAAVCSGTKRRELVKRDDVNALIDGLGVMLTALSSMPRRDPAILW
jgi:hypothetical protein